jgi:serine/threonine protein kinase
MVATNLKTIVPHASKAAIDLMHDLMEWNPAKRPTAAQSIRYQFFTDGEPIPDVIENIHGKSSHHAQPAQAPAQPPPQPQTQKPPRGLRLLSCVCQF